MTEFFGIPMPAYLAWTIIVLIVGAVKVVTSPWFWKWIRNR